MTTTVEEWRIRDPRGPMRDVTGWDRETDGIYVQLSCGHVAVWAPHAGRPEQRERCYECRKAPDNLKKS